MQIVGWYLLRLLEVARQPPAGAGSGSRGHLLGLAKGSLGGDDGSAQKKKSEHNLNNFYLIPVEVGGVGLQELLELVGGSVGLVGQGHD